MLARSVGVFCEKVCAGAVLSLENRVLTQLMDVVYMHTAHTSLLLLMSACQPRPARAPSPPKVNHTQPRVYQTKPIFITCIYASVTT